MRKTEKILRFSLSSQNFIILAMSVTLHCDVGDLKLELYCEECPKTAKNFIALAASGYYDGCKFHRNIKGFMAQSGDPTGADLFIVNYLLLFSCEIYRYVVQWKIFCVISRVILLIEILCVIKKVC